ncbi:hypothetical protein RHGRI_037303 [Rhododendron griersonianum]|uniref:Uncharacterized protein n=1 Tax=Rhododendron griersonianum TaxID=479676 RepID=A0AAV6HUQ7_9ERIC|nr:hypothetical protein RHGRI_037303 [Rhododendron griersonianum]
MANVGIHGARDGSLTAAKGCSSASFCWHFETPSVVESTNWDLVKPIRTNQTNPTVIIHHPPHLGETQTGDPPDLGETQTGNTIGTSRETRINR